MAPLDGVRPFITHNTFLGRLPRIVLDALMGRGQVRSFTKGAVVYRRGDPGDSLMVVIEGRVKLTNISRSGKEVVLHYVGVGDIFGEIAALDGKERAADAIALEDSEVFVTRPVGDIDCASACNAGGCSGALRKSPSGRGSR